MVEVCSPALSEDRGHMSKVDGPESAKFFFGPTFDLESERRPFSACATGSLSTNPNYLEQ